MSEKKLTFNITYPAFQNVKSVMEELHILLTPNKEHKNVFPKRCGKSLKEYLVRDKLPRLEKVENVSHVGKKTSKIYKI